MIIEMSVSEVGELLKKYIRENMLQSADCEMDIKVTENFGAYELEIIKNEAGDGESSS